MVGSSSPGGTMAVDYFLKIDGIPGESVDQKHKNEIQLEAFSWGAMNDSGPVGGGGGAGKVRMQDFSFTMRVNKASPKLLLACAKGQHLKLATFTARREGKAQQEFLVYKFTDVLVSSYQTAGTDDVIPMDQISLAFSRVELEYRPQKPDGSLDGPVAAGWDLKQNKPV
jgi:type VI secretion system secreted protein Hcp